MVSLFGYDDDDDDDDDGGTKDRHGKTSIIAHSEASTSAVEDRVTTAVARGRQVVARPRAVVAEGATRKAAACCR